MFGFLKKKADESVKKFSGQTDFLEAVCAAAALIAAADGEIEDSEIIATKKAVTANKALAAGFDNRTIETCIDTMLDRAGGGRVGRIGLWKEIEEAASKPDFAEAILCTALDVSDADGETEPQEQQVLDRLAKTLRLDLAKFAA